MNLIDELRTLDPRDPGRWPLVVRGLFVILILLSLTLVAADIFNPVNIIGG